MSFFQFCSQLVWHPPCRHLWNCRTSWTVWCADPWLISRCAAISCTVTRRFSFTLASIAAMASGVTTRFAWPDRGQSVTELPLFRNFLLHSYTAVVIDIYHHIELPFIDEFQWVSPLHFVKNEWQNAVPLWCMLQVGPPSLYYCCAVVLRSSIVLPPVGHSSNHEYHCCQLTGQSSGVSNFYHTFKVFISHTFVQHEGPHTEISTAKSMQLSRQ